MKKVLLFLCVVGSYTSVNSMFLATLTRPVRQKCLVPMHKPAVQRPMVHTSPYVACKDETVTISLKCHQRVENVKEDITILKYYCDGVFTGIGKRNNPDIKPSDVINWLEEDLAKNEYVRLNGCLSYMHADDYIKFFLRNQRKSLDKAFIEKYKELQDVQQTWKWFAGYFTDNALKKPISKLLQEMVDHDRKILDLEKMGIFYSNDGKTVIIDPSGLRE